MDTVHGEPRARCRRGVGPARARQPQRAKSEFWGRASPLGGGLVEGHQHRHFGYVPLYHGIAAADEGVALFPKQEGNHWGLAPVFGASPEQQTDAVNSGRYEILPMVALSQIDVPGGRIDLVHLDIQGGEADLVKAALPTLNERVAYLVIGTHSRKIEGQLYDMLLSAGWTIEIDRPAVHFLDRNPPLVSVDGVQGWRNTRLLPL